MLDPDSEHDLDALRSLSTSLTKDLQALIKKRMRKATKTQTINAELLAQFMLFRALAENLGPIVVDEQNEEFVRGIVDQLKTEGIEK